MSNDKKINSHFLQKALVKNFVKDNKIKWMTYQNGKAGSFNIDAPNHKHPIAIKGFYSYDIEKMMNNLESEGITVIRKIAKNSQFENEISLNRKELITLKFYSMLSGVRTQKFRNDILNKNGDSLFNITVASTGESPKDIQEKTIKIIIEYWKENKNGILNNIQMDILKSKDDVVTTACLINISNTLNSRLLIFKFDSNNLLLTEALNFTEQNPISGGILLDFMPIFSNIGIAFYFDPIIMRTTSITKQKSVIFENDVSITRHRNEYVNFEIMKNKQIEYLKNSKNIDKDNLIFWTTESKKYHHKNDKYIYDVLEESAGIADLCNAMALVHCKNSYVIFQNEHDIKNAEKVIKTRGIYRIEDHQ